MFYVFTVGWERSFLFLKDKFLVLSLPSSDKLPSNRREIWSVLLQKYSISPKCSRSSTVGLALGVVERFCAFAMNTVSLQSVWFSPNRFHAPPLIFFCRASQYLPVAELLSDGRRRAALPLLTGNLREEQTGSTGTYLGKKDVLFCQLLRVLQVRLQHLQVLLLRSKWTSSVCIEFSWVSLQYSKPCGGGLPTGRITDI